jgi:hypothetical protein
MIIVTVRGSRFAVRGSAAICAAGVALALLVVGCADTSRNPFRRMPVAPPGAVAWHTTPRAIEPQRVAVLPFALAERVGKGATDLAPSFANSCLLYTSDAADDM